VSGFISRFHIWYRRKFRSFRGWIELERAISYRFPVPEGIVSIFLFLALSSISTLEILNISNLEYLSFLAYAQGASIIAMFNVIVTPMFLSHTFVRGFSDGTMTTYLSYPISRFNIMVLKVYLPTVFLGCSVTIPLVLYIHIAFSGITPLNVVILYTIALWATIIFVGGVTSLIAVISKSVIATSFVSIATVYSLFAANISNYKNPYIVQGTFNPVDIVTRYYSGVLNPDINPPPPTILDVTGSFIGAIFIGIGLLILALFIFKLREV
jgi:ABC-type transport system involved in multi-copper enzyme maturation permease subunit